MFEVLLEKMALALESIGAPYMVIGGQAVLIYGEPRFSKDIDVTLGWDADKVLELIAMVHKLGWKVLVDNPADFAVKTMVLPCEDPQTGIRFDFIFSFSPYERQALDRAVERTVGQAHVRYASAEDLVILKIISGRPRDIEDVKGVLLKNPGLEDAYIRKWLSSFEKALDQPFLSIYQRLKTEVA